MKIGARRRCNGASALEREVFGYRVAPRVRQEEATSGGRKWRITCSRIGAIYANPLRGAFCGRRLPEWLSGALLPAQYPGDGFNDLTRQRPETQGMRWRTFERLEAKHDAFVRESLAGMARACV